MNFVETALPGVLIIEPEMFGDERGHFLRTFDTDAFSHAGLVHAFPQISMAHNARAGTLRGLHFQRAPHAETKVVRCTRGSLFDVAVDIRPKSATFGKWVAARLDAQSQRAIYIPVGYAHGYMTLEDDTDAEYMISVRHAPESASGVHYADVLIGIEWPVEVTVVSQRDQNWPTLERAQL